MNQIAYTHAEHALRCHLAALTGSVLSSQYVQVKKRQITYCARLKAAWTVPDSNIDCWTVETTFPETIRFTTPVSQVRLCGDSNCACKAEDAAQRERFSAGLAASSDRQESK